jgi:hypothetical protein
VNVTVEAGATLQLAGSKSALGSSGANLASVTNNGTIVSSGANALAGITGNGTVSVTAGTLELPAGGGNNRVIKNASVTISGGGKLDVHDNKMILAATTYDAVATLVKAGQGTKVGGVPQWNASGIVTGDASLSSTLTTLAVATAADAGYGGSKLFAGFSVSASDVLVMYTYSGDANLSGFIDADDYFNVDRAYARGSVPKWNNGDFNYDGSINADDYFLIDQGYMLQTTSFSTAAVAGVTVVPEPASLAMLVAAGSLFVRRKHLRRK